MFDEAAVITNVSLRRVCWHHALPLMHMGIHWIELIKCLSLCVCVCVVENGWCIIAFRWSDGTGRWAHVCYSKWFEICFNSYLNYYCVHVLRHYLIKQTNSEWRALNAEATIEWCVLERLCTFDSCVCVFDGVGWRSPVHVVQWHMQTVHFCKERREGSGGEERATERW